MIDDPVEEEGEPLPDADAIALWLETGLEPWRLLGWPADPPLPVLDYWGWRALQYITAQRYARQYLDSLPPALQRERAQRQRMKILHGDQS